MALVIGELPHRKPPLATFTLSATSFLNCAVIDNVQNHALYTISTNGTSTVVWRNVVENGEVVKVADIRWPKPVKRQEKRPIAVLIQMKDERWTTGNHFLSPAKLLGAHKFYITGYSQALKWRRLGLSYHCTTKALRGPIAILETALASHPARISFHETLHHKYDATALSMHSGVSVLLLDYIITTSLLLLTDPYEWMNLPNHGISPPLSEPQKSHGLSRLLSAQKHKADAPSSGSTARPWRRLPFGGKVLSHLSSSAGQGRSEDIAQQTTAAQIAKVVYREPLFPKLNNATAVHEDVDGGSVNQEEQNNDTHSEEEDVPQDEHEEVYRYLTSSGRDRPWLRHSPSSINSSMPCVLLTPLNASNHVHLDPTFYSDTEELRPQRKISIEEPERYPSQLEFGSSLSPTTSISSGAAIRPLPSIPPSQPLSQQSHPLSSFQSHRQSYSQSRNHRHPQFSDMDHDPPASTQLPQSFALAPSRSQSAPPDESQRPSSTIVSFESGASRRMSCFSSASAAGTRARRVLPQVPPVPSLPSSPNSTSLGSPLHRSTNSRSLPSPPVHQRSFFYDSAGSRIPHESARSHQVSELGVLIDQYRDIPPLHKSHENILYSKVGQTAISPSSRTTVFDLPPPAYHSINFHLPSPVMNPSEMSAGITDVYCFPDSPTSINPQLYTGRSTTEHAVGGRRSLPRPPWPPQRTETVDMNSQ